MFYGTYLCLKSCCNPIFVHYIIFFSIFGRLRYMCAGHCPNLDVTTYIGSQSSKCIVHNEVSLALNTTVR